MKTLHLLAALTLLVTAPLAAQQRGRSMTPEERAARAAAREAEMTAPRPIEALTVEAIQAYRAGTKN